jgi:DNA-binding response OmpR family regulator
VARVLVVEDEANIADALSRGLGAEGFAVDLAADGVEALWKATSQCYDVVLLDVMLPALSGYEVLKRMRAAAVWTPVLMVTAKDGEHDIADGLDIGADDYLTKPFSFRSWSPGCVLCTVAVAGNVRLCWPPVTWFWIRRDGAASAAALPCR